MAFFYFHGHKGLYEKRNDEHTITIEKLEFVVSPIVGLFSRLLLRRTAGKGKGRTKNFD